MSTIKILIKANIFSGIESYGSAQSRTQWHLTVIRSSLKLVFFKKNKEKKKNCCLYIPRGENCVVAWSVSQWSLSSHSLTLLFSLSQLALLLGPIRRVSALHASLLEFERHRPDGLIGLLTPLSPRQRVATGARWESTSARRPTGGERTDSDLFPSWTHQISLQASVVARASRRRCPSRADPPLVVTREEDATISVVSPFSSHADSPLAPGSYRLSTPLLVRLHLKKCSLMVRPRRTDGLPVF